MWDRVDLKMEGRAKFLKNYGPAVLVSFIMALALTKITTQYSNDSTVNTILQFQGIHFNMGGVSLNMNIAGIAFVLLDIFVFQILIVGGCRFYIENRDYNAPVSKILFGFQSGHYGNTVFVLFMQNLFIVLWTMLFIIPGIVKSYSYRMVPYILAEQPDIDYKEAIHISRSMMDGHKFDAFALDLSFFGWLILTAFTCGILGIFYVKPYRDATNAELYVVLRENWFAGNSGRTSDGAGQDWN